MKQPLTELDVEPAVYGGVILGGGGGGHINEGLRIAKLAVDFGLPELWSTDEVDSQTLVATCAGVGAPGAPDKFLRPVHYKHSLDQLHTAIQDKYARSFSGLVSNENGAMGTVNGWLQSALSGLPVLDAPCNGRAHPTALMGALGLHREQDYLSFAGYAGGSPDNYVEGNITGVLDRVSQVVRSASIAAGGLVAVARNPVPVDRLDANAAIGGISQAMKIGRAWQDDGLNGCVAELGGKILTRGKVKSIEIQQRDGFDVGRCTIDGIQLEFVNEYLDAHYGDEPLAAFPDLLMTFDADDQPLVSADLVEGQEVTVIMVPSEHLILSSTMRMGELMDPIRSLQNDR